MEIEKSKMEILAEQRFCCDCKEPVDKQWEMDCYALSLGYTTIEECVGDLMDTCEACFMPDFDDDKPGDETLIGDYRITAGPKSSKVSPIEDRGQVLFEGEHLKCLEMAKNTTISKHEKESCDCQACAEQIACKTCKDRIDDQEIEEFQNAWGCLNNWEEKSNQFPDECLSCQENKAPQLG